MTKRKKKLTPEQKRAKRLRKEQFETIFVGGKQKRVRRREPLIEGLPADEFIRRNADPIWLHQNERWDLLEADGSSETPSLQGRDHESDDESLPF